MVFEGEEREALVGLFVNIHATRGLVLSAGPGVEFSKEHHAEGDVEAESAEASSESSTHAALRAGGLYEFELGRRATIAPAVYVDMISGKKPARSSVMYK